MQRSLLRWVLASLLLSLAASALVASAQDADEEEEEEAPAAPPAPTGPQTTTGRNDVSAVIDRTGRILELHSKARIFIPPNLPVANRRVRFAESRDRVTPSQIADGFTRIGPIFSFDGAIDATRAPVVISIRQPRDPGRRASRLVLAMEGPSICREGSQPLPGASAGICSGCADH